MKAGQSYNRKLDETQVSKMAEKARLTPDLLQPSIQNAVRIINYFVNKFGLLAQCFPVIG